MTTPPSLPKISVITPAFNHARFLEQTMRSVLDQQYPALEYWVMDGGSQDGTTDLLRRYDARLAGWVSEKDRGQCHAFNKGLARSAGDIIGWLNSDDVYLHRNLFAAADYFARHPDVDIVFADYLYMDAGGRILKRRREIPFNASIYLWTEDCYHANCAGFFRRRVFDRTGPLPENYHYSMDYDFYLRAAHAGFRFGHVHQYWAAYRLHESSKSVSFHDRQQKESAEIRARLAPHGVPAWMTPALRGGFRAWRILRKALIGSYLPVRLPERVEDMMAIATTAE
jgi:glycosyltransferase involved in cell wall biosynthesis